jgi:hypothetical protein
VGLVGGLWLGRLLGAEVADVVDVQGGGVGCEDEGLRGEGVDERRGVDATVGTTNVSSRPCMGRGTVWAYASRGTAILAVTWPVVESATFTIPSVPAEYSCEPSTLKPSVLQLPLCRRVFHTVSMCPNPLAAVVSLSLSSLALPGSLYVCTCPDARPTATIGSAG